MEKEAVFYSRLSYKTPEYINQLYPGTRFKFIQNLGTDCQVYIFDKKYITFRGSSSIKDIYFDLRLKYINDKNNCSKVHSGFYKQYLSVRDELDEYIKNEMRYETNIVYTGHSLGGALACIAYSYRNREKINRLITFACPRVGDSGFNRLIESNYCHYILNKDIICKIPLLFYTELPREVIKYNGKWWNIINNHKISSYYSALKKEF